MSFPSDPYFALQWHLYNENPDQLDLNLIGVWPGEGAAGPVYTGAGVRVAILADGFDYNHPDLRRNYDRALDHDFEFGSGDAVATGPSGTAMAGLIGAAADGRGAVGVAYDSTLIGYRMRDAYAPELTDDLAGALLRAADDRADVLVVQRPQSDVPEGLPPETEGEAGFRKAVQVAVEDGRDGLGLSIVKGAGLDHFLWSFPEPEPDVNLDPWTRDTRQIVVAGVNELGAADFQYGPVSGAPILVSAFGWMSVEFSTERGGTIVTTDRPGLAGFSRGSYVLDYGGPDAAAAMVGGVVALMHEANPDLGWRDVQSILAASARHVGRAIGVAPEPWETAGDLIWGWNGAGTWNGGGMHFANAYGYGLVDAWAAVRLAETWRLTGEAAATSRNEAHASFDVLDRPLEVTWTRDPESQGAAVTGETSGETATDFVVERVAVTIAADLHALEAFSLVLVSPSGTESALLSRDGIYAASGAWTFESQAFRGERSTGEWTVRVVNHGAYETWGVESATHRLTDAVVDLYGASTRNDRYVFTDEYSKYAGTVEYIEDWYLDGDGGIDTVNVAAVSSASVIRLGGTSRIDGVETRLSGIENAIGGDFGDSITGDGGANSLHGRRGDDRITGGGGDDRLFGDWGDDVLNGGRGADLVEGGAGDDTIVDDDGLSGDRLRGGAGTDTIDYSRAAFADGTVTINLSAGTATSTNGSARDTITGFENAIGGAGGETIRGTARANALSGGGGDDRLIGGAGDDVLTGGAGADRLMGGPGADRFVFRSKADSPVGGHDRLMANGGAAAFDAPGARAGDVIDLQRIDANETIAGNQAFKIATSQAPGTLRIVEQSGVTAILGYVDAKRGADFRINIHDGPGVHASAYAADDFIL